MSVGWWGIKKGEVPGMLLHKCWLIGPGLGFDDIEEVACMDEHVGFLVDDLIYRFEKIVIDLLFAEVHPALGIEGLNAAKPKVGVGDVDEVHFR